MALGLSESHLKGDPKARRKVRTDVVVAATVWMLVVGVLAYAIYFYKPSQTYPTLSTGPSTSTFTGPSNTVSGSESSTSVTPVLNPASLVVSLDSLFGNISQMTAISRTNSSIATVAIEILGRPTINSTRYWEVNFTLSYPPSPSGSGSKNSSAEIWFDTSGNPAITKIGSIKYTQDQAKIMSENYIGPFELSVNYTGLFFRDQTNLNKLHYLGLQTQSVGPTSMTLATYSCMCSPPISLGDNINVRAASLNLG